MHSLFWLWILPIHSCAKIVKYNWKVGWVTACPDGFCRPVIGINGIWPCPILEVELGDAVIITVRNELGNETTSIHWHGINQIGTPQMDGVAMVTQCPIPDGEAFTHTFLANPGGTRWYHSHDKGQYPDGLRAPLIVHDRAYEAALAFDKQFIFSVSDWYHEPMPELIHEYLDGSDFEGQSLRGFPLPASSLINDTTSINLDVLPGKKYLLRMVSIAALFAHEIFIEDHEMLVVAIDGVTTVPTTAQAITIAAGQRYDVLITGKPNPTKNYEIRSLMRGTKLGRTGVLNYGFKSVSSNQTLQPVASVATLPARIDDFTLTAKDGQPLLGPVDRSIIFPITYGGKAGRRIYLANVTYVSPKVPTLYTAMTTGINALNPIVYGRGVNPHVIKSGQVVQIVVENFDIIEHPMHLHGYVYQVVARGEGPWDGVEGTLPRMPMRRDTTTTPPRGHLVIRFKAQNPGVWVFHCHMEFHVEAGMMATIIESPDILQRTLVIPKQHIDVCDEQDIPTHGNCAGRMFDVFNVEDCNNEPEDEDWGALTHHHFPFKWRGGRRPGRWL